MSKNALQSEISSFLFGVSWNIQLDTRAWVSGKTWYEQIFKIRSWRRCGQKLTEHYEQGTYQFSFTIVSLMELIGARESRIHLGHLFFNRHSQKSNFHLSSIEFQTVCCVEILDFVFEKFSYRPPDITYFHFASNFRSPKYDGGCLGYGKRRENFYENQTIRSN